MLMLFAGGMAVLSAAMIALRMAVRAVVGPPNAPTAPETSERSRPPAGR